MGGTDAPDMHSLPFTDATSADGNPSKLIRQGDTRRAPGYAVDPTAAVDSAVTFRRVIILSTDSPYHGQSGDVCRGRLRVQRNGSKDCFPTSRS
eukprot:Lankesteria_metandrocarpae@DN5333_c2_g1_i4.p1